ncbi:MAG: hypothetical protein IPJ87_00855 [Flavobacteriales bacterium]|nr:hypothetical protein [Flavobacteriales bacterium]MBK8950151.1 hypothetical protein [Flavobacteriales bacterium]
MFHLLEHHSDLGHHDHEGSDHGHEDGSDDHNPFQGHAGEVCGAMTIVCIAADHPCIHLSVPTLERTLAPSEDDDVLVAYTGSKWNPPKRA